MRYVSGILLLLGIAVGSAHAVVITVGSAAEAACDHNTMAGALLAAAFNPGTDEIRISNAFNHNGSVLAPGTQDLIISGDWANCSGTPSTSYATLDGTGNAAGPVLRMQCSASPCSLTLRRLNVTGGENGNLEIAGQATVFLDGAQLTSSVAPGDGGSVRIDGSLGAHLILENLAFVGNSTAAGNGGALWCSGALPKSVSKRNIAPGGLVPIEAPIEVFDSLIANGSAVDGRRRLSHRWLPHASAYRERAGAVQRACRQWTRRRVRRT